MILGVGVDLVDVHRMERALNCRWGKRFVAKVFSAEEIAACKDAPQPAQGYADALCSKGSAGQGPGDRFFQRRLSEPNRCTRGRKT